MSEINTENENAVDSFANADVGPDLHDSAVHASLDRYWWANIKLTVFLIAVWAFVGLGCGVLWADFLNNYKLPGTGYPLGFWFAQQGSIIVFVLLILVYCVYMNRLDAKHHRELEAIKKEGRSR